MLEETVDGVRLFYAYARRDEVLHEDLNTHLSLLKRHNLSTLWSNYVIDAGEEWEKGISEYLESADVILLLISPDFLHSDFYDSAEMHQAIQRHEAREARIIPIILRPVSWHNTWLSKLQALPTNGKPVTRWSSRDDAFRDIVRGIRRAIQELIESSPIRSSGLNTLLRSGDIGKSVGPSPLLKSGGSGKLVPPMLWNIPYRRNPFFTGRDDVLRRLHKDFTEADTTNVAQVQAISGLGGIGKTQIAVEYAYRYRDDYRSVLWARGSNYDCLLADFVSISDLLQLPQKDEQDQGVIIRAVKRWLERHADWLLIFDNVNDIATISTFLPEKASRNGHILLTSRSIPDDDTIKTIIVEKMNSEEGVLLLLRRARVLPPNMALELASEDDRLNAEEIVRTMDGLPLALDQAGAYIEETGLNFLDYLNLYKARSQALLRRRGQSSTSHPDAVDTTWEISFRAVEQEKPAAVDLLCFCAFFAPDAIPEEILTDAAGELGDSLGPTVADEFLLNEAMETLRRYSLIKRDTETKTLSIHRLMQIVLKNRISKDIQRVWAERAVKAINKVIPIVDREFLDEGERSVVQFQRYLPQALACIELIDAYSLTFPESAQLLDRVGDYLQKQGQYQEAEQLLRRSLSLWEKVAGSKNVATIQILYNLAALYQAQKKYEQAVPLLQEALTIVEQVTGMEHPVIARIRSNLAYLYKEMGRYEVAEQLFHRALLILEQAPDTQHIDLITTLNYLADLYREQNRNEEAREFLQRALSICEQELGLNHPETVIILNNLGLLYLDSKRYEEATPLFERAVHVCEQIFGSMHLYTAGSLDYLAQSYRYQGKYVEAESCLQKTLHIRRLILGPEHSDTVNSLYSLAMLYHAVGKYTIAEVMLERLLTIPEQILQQSNVSTADVLDVLAVLSYVEGKYEKSDAFLQHRLSILEQDRGSDLRRQATIFNTLAIINRIQGRYEEAEALFLQALAIYEQVGGEQDLNMAPSLNHLAVLYYMQGRFGHAESLYQRALKMYEHAIHQSSLEQVATDWFGENGALNVNYFETLSGLNELGLLLQEAGEVAQSLVCFDLLLEFLGFPSMTSHSGEKEPRLAVQEVQHWLKSIIQNISVVRVGSSRLERTTALMQAISSLARVPQGLEMLLPARRLFVQCITDSWSEIVKDEAGRVGEPEILEEVYSPYIFTTPTRTVIGREDLFQRITSLWARQGQRNSLLIYGQHRMGKTSLVQAIMQHCDLGSDTTLIYFSAESINLEHEGYLYYEIAYRMWLAVDEKVKEPQLHDYVDSDARTAFNRFLTNFDSIMGTDRFILVIDEFELLYRYLGQEVATKTIAYLRVQTQTYHWLALGIVGLSDLRDLKRSYNSLLRGGWEEMKVTFLEKEWVTEILLHPPNSPDFPLKYREGALELINTLTAGQPLLVQVIGDMLVQHYNHVVFVLHQEHRGMFDIADVQIVVGDVSFYNRAAAYFKGVWSRVVKGSFGEKEILLTLASHEDGLEEDVLRDMAELPAVAFAEALGELERHDILHRLNGRLCYKVPLMQHWVRDIYYGADADFIDEIEGR